MSSRAENKEKYSKIKYMLQGWIAQVKFQKKDGSIREMFCTLNPGYLNELGLEVPKERPSDNYSLALRVVDLQKLEARSLPVSRIEQILYYRVNEVIIPDADLNLTI